MRVQELGLILTLAGGLGAALVFGYVTQRLGLSPIVGYLLAGVAHRPAHARLRRQSRARRAARRSRRHPADVRRRAAVSRSRNCWPCGALPCPARSRASRSATLLGAWAARLFGWAWTSALVFGLTLSVASTVVLVRVLSDNTAAAHVGRPHRRRLARRRGLLTVIMLVLLPTLVGGNASVLGHRSATSALTLLKVGAARRLRRGRRHAADSGAARPGGGHALARAVHADRAGARARHRRRRRRSSSACRWRSAPSSPAWSSAAPTTACARRPTRCRCATRSPCCSSSRSACCSIRRTLLAAPWLALAALGRRRRRQAARGRGRAGGDALSAAHGAHRAVGARADRRVLVHPGRAGARPRRAARGRHRHRRGRLDRVDRDQPARGQG